MVSRQQARPNRSFTNTARRFRVQRGGGAAPVTGGLAAACWAARTSTPRAASIAGQKGGGRRCAGRLMPRGRACCSCEATPSRSEDDAPCVRPPGWRNRPRRCREERETARGSGRARHPGPAGVSPTPFGPNGHDLRVTPIQTRFPWERPDMETFVVQPRPELRFSSWMRFKCRDPLEGVVTRC